MPISERYLFCRGSVAVLSVDIQFVSSTCQTGPGWSVGVPRRLLLLSLQAGQYSFSS